MSDNITEQEKKLLEEFEKMLEEKDDDDFGFFIPGNQLNYPSEEDLEYPDEPPPLPKEVECKHKNRKKVVISANLKYWLCKDCGADWDFKDGE